MIITLCGSTRYRDEYKKLARALTLAGFAVFECVTYGHAEKADARKRILETPATQLVAQAIGSGLLKRRSSVEYSQADRMCVDTFYYDGTNATRDNWVVKVKEAIERNCNYGDKLLNELVEQEMPKWAKLSDQDKSMLDLAHLKKISASDAIIVIGAPGESTKREIEWAKMNSKPVIMHEPGHHSKATADVAVELLLEPKLFHTKGESHA